MKSLSKKVISITIIICFIFNLNLINFASAKGEGKKAVIIIPGICGSELFSAENQEINSKFYPRGHRFWPPECIVPFVDILVNANEFKDDINKIEKFNVDAAKSDLDLIACNDNAMSKVNMMPNNPILDCKNNPDDRNFGIVNCYKELVKSVVGSVDDKEYDVVFFSYDWRRSNKDTAKDLENLITEKNYEDVTLIGHSMGTLVCASYLSDAQNKSKVDKTILLGGPLLGAVKAYSVLDEGRFVDGILGIMTCPIIAPIIRNIAKNCPAVYELLPPKQYFNVEPDGYLSKWPTKDSATNQPIKIKNYEDTVEFIKNRGISNFSDELLHKAQNFYDSMFKDNHFVLEDKNVKVYNIIGINQSTPNGVVVNEKSKYEMWTNRELKANGDGMVTVKSALVGDVLSKKNNYYLKDVSHMGLMLNKFSLDLICNILNNKLKISGIDKLVIQENMPMVIK